ncbi:MAG: hypothetical protein AAAFM81_06055, partial [Pseudomonadota bacterium]
NGSPVATTGMSFRHDFRYSEQRLTPRQRQLISTTKASRAATPVVAEDETPSAMPSDEDNPASENPTNDAADAPIEDATDDEAPETE